MARSALLLLAMAAVACGSSTPTGPSPSPPVPVPPASQTHALAGRVTDAASGGPVPAAQLQFMTGINAGRLATADADGRYRLEGLRAGGGLLRVYGPRHTAVEQTFTVPVAGPADFTLAATSRDPAVAPFTYRGVVWDSRGSPVGGAAVAVLRDSGATLAFATSGADGSFTITTQSAAGAVRVTRDGFVPVENRAPPALAATVEVNVALPRITRYALQAIPPLRVGQSATLMAEVETDDGITTVGRLYASARSSSEAVATVNDGVVVGRAAGSTTIEATYSGLNATLTLQVVP